MVKTEVNGITETPISPHPRDAELQRLQNLIAAMAFELGCTRGMLSRVLKLHTTIATDSVLTEELEESDHRLGRVLSRETVLPLNGYAVLRALMQCSASDPNRDKPSAGKWVTINVPIDVYQEAARCAGMSHER